MIFSSLVKTISSLVEFFYAQTRTFPWLLLLVYFLTGQFLKTLKKFQKAAILFFYFFPNKRNEGQLKTVFISSMIEIPTRGSQREWIKDLTSKMLLPLVFYLWVLIVHDPPLSLHSTKLQFWPFPRMESPFPPLLAQNRLSHLAYSLHTCSKILSK